MSGIASARGIGALAQAGPALRVAEFDNASGDTAAAVVAELAANDRLVTFHSYPEDIGVLANFQFGLAQGRNASLLVSVG